MMRRRMNPSGCPSAKPSEQKIKQLLSCIACEYLCRDNNHMIHIIKIGFFLQDFPNLAIKMPLFRKKRFNSEVIFYTVVFTGPPIFRAKNLLSQPGALLHWKFLEKVALVGCGLLFILVLKIVRNSSKHPVCHDDHDTERVLQKLRKSLNLQTKLWISWKSAHCWQIQEIQKYRRQNICVECAEIQMANI